MEVLVEDNDAHVEQEDEMDEIDMELGPSAEDVYKAAAKIQAIGRMRLGMMKVQRIRLRNHRQALMERYSGSGMYRFYFEQQGAALMIQHWYMRSNVRKLWYMKQMIKKYGKVREGKAAIIQRQWRGYLGRKKFASMVLAAQIAADNKTPAAKRIQALSRRFLARCRLPALKYEKLEYVTAHHVPSFRAMLTARRRSRLVDILIPRDENFTSLNKKQPEAVVASPVPAAAGRKGVAGKKRGKPVKASIYQPKAPEPIYEHWQRRKAVCFPSFKFPTAECMDDMLKCVVLIQKTYRHYISRRYIKASRDTKFYFAARHIQRWIRRWFYLVSLTRSLEFLQPLWRYKIRKWLKRVRCTVRIQAQIRRYLVRRSFMKLRNERHSIVRRIQRFLNTRLCHQKVRGELAARRTIQDDRQAGKSLYKVSEHFLLADYMWVGMKSKKEERKKSNVHVQTTSSHELQTMFGYYGTMGMVDMNRCSKMMKDAKGLLEGRIDSMFVELTFTKLKSAGDKRIDFSQFLGLLYCIATVKYSDITIKICDPGPGATLAEKKEQMCISGKLAGEGGIGSLNEPNEHEVLNSFRFCRLVGIGAYITRIVDEHLSHLTEYGRAINALKKKSSVSMVHADINIAVRLIQRQFRRKAAMLRHVRRKKEEAARMLQARRLAGSIVIQSIVRLFIHRRRVVRLAQLVYKKYIDAKEKREYWFNPLTKCSFWGKPALLMHLDCGSAIMLPTSQEEFVVLCNMCMSRSANAFCLECAESMCKQCFESTHKAGKRASHVMLPQTICVQCEYQVGSKFCLSCDDAYCDTCFKYMHRKGRLKLHTFKWMCPCCDECEDRAVQWDRAAPADNYVVHSFCTVCVWKKFGNPKNAKFVTHNVYQDKSVMDYHRAQEEAREKKYAEETYAIRAGQNRERRRQRATLNIQRVYRGHRKRCQIANFLKQRRAFQDLRELEMPYRNSALYIVLTYFGFGPALKSDTTLERAQKLYPVYMHPVVEACIEYKWSVACDYIRELDKHKHKHKAILSKTALAGMAKAKANAKAKELSDIGAKIPIDTTAISQFSDKVNAEAMQLGSKINTEAMELGSKLAIDTDALAELGSKLPLNKSPLKGLGAKAPSRSMSSMSFGGSFRGSISTPAFMEGFINAYYVWTTHSAYVKAQKYLEFRKEEHEKKLIAMRNARSDRKLHDMAVVDAAELEQVKADLDEKHAEYMKAQDDYDTYAGPSSLPKLISHRRKHGIQLPFKVNMTKGNTLALTVWPDDLTGPGSPTLLGDPLGASAEDPAEAPVAVGGKSVKGKTAFAGLTKAKLDKNNKAGGGGGGTVVSAATMSTLTTAKGLNPKKQAVDMASEMTVSPRPDLLSYTPAKWRKHLKEGMEVVIMGIPFTLINKRHRILDHESSVLYDEESYVSELAIPLAGKKKKGKKGEESVEAVSDTGTNVESPVAVEGAVAAADNPGSPGSPGSPDAKEDDDDSSFDSDSDYDSDDEKGSRDGELALEVVADTRDHFRVNRPWVLDSRESLDIYKVMPKPLFSMLLYRAERIGQRAYVLQKVCAVLAITAHKTGKLNKYLGHFFDEESSIGSWFRGRARVNHDTRNYWLKRSNSVVEMSYDFSLRRQITRASIRTLRMIRALARAGVRAIEKFRKEQKKKILSDYDKWMQSTDKVTVIVMLQLDKIQPRQNLGDVSLDLEAPADILRTAIQRKLREELNKTLGGSFLFFKELDNGKDLTLARNKEAGTYSRDIVPFIMNQKTLIGAATAILVKEGDVKPAPIPKWIDPLASVKARPDGDNGSVSSADDSSVMS